MIKKVFVVFFQVLSAGGRSPKGRRGKESTLHLKQFSWTLELWSAVSPVPRPPPTFSFSFARGRVWELGQPLVKICFNHLATGHSPSSCYCWLCVGVGSEPIEKISSELWQLLKLKIYSLEFPPPSSWDSGCQAAPLNGERKELWQLLEKTKNWRIGDVLISIFLGIAPESCQYHMGEWLNWLRILLLNMNTTCGGVWVGLPPWVGMCVISERNGRKLVVTDVRHTRMHTYRDAHVPHILTYSA